MTLVNDKHEDHREYHGQACKEVRKDEKKSHKRSRYEINRSGSRMMGFATRGEIMND